MNKQAFLINRLILAFLVAAVVSISAVEKNYIVPIVVIITAAIVLFVMQKNVEKTSDDERGYRLADKAASWSLYAYVTVAALTAMIFMAMRDQDPSFELIGSILAYSACALLILYSIVFNYLQRKK